MKIVEPFARLESEMAGQAIIEKIARAARTSHKSAGKGYAEDCALVAKLKGRLRQARELVPVVFDGLEADVET